MEMYDKICYVLCALLSRNASNRTTKIWLKNCSHYSSAPFWCLRLTHAWIVFCLILFIPQVIKQQQGWWAASPQPNFNEAECVSYGGNWSQCWSKAESYTMFMALLGSEQIQQDLVIRFVRFCSSALFTGIRLGCNTRHGVRPGGTVVSGRKQKFFII